MASGFPEPQPCRLRQPAASTADHALSQSSTEMVPVLVFSGSPSFRIEKLVTVGTSPVQVRRTPCATKPMVFLAV